jgi:uncharacterized protein YqeY
MLEEKIFSDYKEAMKNRDTLKSSVLSFLRAAMINTAMEKKKKSLEDNDVIGVIKKQVKQRQDSIEQFQKGNRQDLADKEISELVILKAYLPEELSSNEIKKIVEECVALTGALGMKDMGRVMKEANARIAGKADSKLVSDLVRECLTKATP